MKYGSRFITIQIFHEIWIVMYGTQTPSHSNSLYQLRKGFDIKIYMYAVTVKFNFNIYFS